MPGGALRDRLFAIDGRSLAAFRICIGALVVADLLTRAGALVQHYTDAGVLPRAALDRLFLLSDWHWSMHLWTGSAGGQAVLFAVAAAAAGALIVGYRTRLATVVTWVLLVSLQARNPMVSYGADQLLRLELFWAMFLPLGATWSLDRRRARRASGTRADGDPGRHLSMASAALLLQPCVMYVFSGLLKQNPAWWSGDAIAHALSAETYATRFGRALLEHPALLESLTLVVPWIELLAPAALFVPWATPWFRTGALLLLAAFHLGIASVLITGLFQPVALAALLPFVPGVAWDRASTVVALRRGVAPAPPRPRRGRWYATALQGLVAALFVYALAWNVAGLRIEEYTARQSLAWYREWWAAGRKGVPLTFRDYGVERMLGPVGWIGRVAGLHQRWDMFHRVGAEIRGWPLIVGTLGDGRRISVLEGGRPFAGAAHPRPDDALAFYPGTRWLVYFTYLRTPGTRPARELLPPVVARDWARRHPEDGLRALAILFVRPAVPAEGAPAPEPEVWFEGPVVPFRDRRRPEGRREVCSASPAPAPRPPGAGGAAARAAVGVPVVGDLAADGVDDVVVEARAGGALEGGGHVGDGLGRRIGAVPLPDHHRDVADLAVRHPADLVLVVPAREARRFAEIAAAGAHRLHPEPAGRRLGAWSPTP